jgi:hypothetical protein
MKFYLVYALKNDGRLSKFDSKDEAIAHAKRIAHADAGGDPVYVMESVLLARRPVPDVETELM